MQKSDLARAVWARGAGAAVPPELLDTLPSQDPLNIGPSHLLVYPGLSHTRWRLCPPPLPALGALPAGQAPSRLSL